MTTRKGFSPILMIIPVAFVLGIAATLLYFQLKPKPTAPSQTTQSGQVTSPTASPKASPQQSTDEIAGWKTYTNENLKLSLKYPSTWIIEEKVNPIQEADKTNNYYFFKIKSANGSYLEISDWIAGFGPFSQGDAITEKTYKVNNREIKITLLLDGDVPRKHIMFGTTKVDKRDFYFLVDFISDSGSVRKSDWETIEQIINTIDFKV